MRSLVASLWNLVVKPGAANRLQWCPVETCRAYSYAQQAHAPGILNSKNSKRLLDTVQNDVSDNSKQLFLADKHDKSMNVEQNVKVDAARSTSVLEPCTEDLSTVAPFFQPSFNFAAYVNNSPTLQELVKLGVDLHSLERRKDVPEFILRLEFRRDMKEHIR
jgi:hypothetical protein